MESEEQKRMKSAEEIYSALMTSTLEEIAKKAKDPREKEFILSVDTRLSVGFMVWALYKKRITSCTKEVVMDIYEGWSHGSEAMKIRTKMMA
jgi:hypothetical protein